MNEQGTPQGEQPMQPQDSPPETPPHALALGPIVGVIVIILVLLLGGYYVWDTQLRDGQVGPELEDGAELSSEEDPALTELQTQGSSDALGDIEADLNNTEFESLDQELAELDTELGSF